MSQNLITSSNKSQFIKKTKKFHLGSIHSERDRLYAASLVSEGEVIGVFNRGVNAIWLDGQNPKALEKLHQVKGEKRKGRPVALTIGLTRITKMIDLNHISREVNEFLNLSKNLKTHLGSLCFLKAPIKKRFVKKVPPSALSFDGEGRVWVQSWDPYGHKQTEKLIKLMHLYGIKYPAVTSMNISGSPEIVDQKEAEKFCLENSIMCYLQDECSNPKLQGSYTIITLNDKGIELTREGNIPGKIIEPIFRNIKFITESTKMPNYPQIQFPLSLIEKLNPQGIRLAILLYLEGKEVGEIRTKLSKYTEII